MDSAQSGGSYRNGTIYRLNTDGSVFTVLHDFANAGDSLQPQSPLVLRNGVIFGTTTGIYGEDSAALYRFDASATDRASANFTNLHTFLFAFEGGYALGGVQAADSMLYGAFGSGSANGNGAVYRIAPDGSGLALLHVFSEQDPVTGIYGSRFRADPAQSGVFGISTLPPLDSQRARKPTIAPTSPPCGEPPGKSERTGEATAQADGAKKFTPPTDGKERGQAQK